MTKELNIQNEIRLNLPENVRMFRNNVGTGWIGKTGRTKSGAIIIENARPLHSGLCVGSSDLIGWTSIEITPEMIGKKIAIFTALEIKTQTGKISKEQTNFIETVNRFGGIASVLRSVDDLNNLFDNIK